MTTQPLTEQQLNAYETAARAAMGSWGIYEHGNDGSVTDITAEVRRLRTELADAWVPCSPAWLAANPGQCPTAPRVAGPGDISHLHPAVLADMEEMAASLARDGFGPDEIANMLGGITEAATDIAAADNPTPLRWGLNDVLWGDDDTVTVLLSGPEREPYWLELDPERAAVLREDLAGPPAA